MKIAIVYQSFFDHEGLRPVVGGVQTYLLFLGRLCTRLGYPTSVYQVASRTFRNTIDDVEVVGVPCKGKSFRTYPRHVCSAAMEGFDQKQDLLVFGSDRFLISNAPARSLAIQHGISWDLPSRYLSSRRWWRGAAMGRLMKFRQRRRALQLFHACQNRVCVDYNFPNWVRTFLPDEPSGKFWVIPNFTKVVDPNRMQNRQWAKGPLKVLFARRFTEFRGTRIFADVVDRILSDSVDVSFTFAGEGPDESYLKRRFSNQPSVKFVKYAPDESQAVQLQHHVAVVPSLGSEGTSLSAAEAMGAGAVVVAASVGGLTNMIIDGFNGLLCHPSSDAFEQKIRQLAGDRKWAATLASQGYKTAQEAFSLSRWEASWEGVLRQIAS
ncbi:MAG: glycosyltransferase family 4 protein [Planctomycetaceae bacterium]|nr:glycosyltransferase family 4 protein [Planctomycetaceae bacterium]